MRKLTTAFPSIAAEYSESNSTPLSEVTASSGRQYIWTCTTYGHEWGGMSVGQRTQQGQGCPYCSNRRLLAGFNDIQSRYPDLIAASWDWSRNAIQPSETYGRANEKFFWLCSRGHSHYRDLRHELEYGCGICSRHTIIAGVNDAWTAASKDIRSEWSTNNVRPLSGFSPNSHYPGLWICSSGHEYSASIGRRFEGEGRCPICINRKLLQGFNDLASKGPELALEFDSEKNGCEPSEVIFGSAGKFWWRCKTNLDHSWRAALSTRLSQNTQCPLCRASLFEASVFSFIESFGRDTLRNDRKLLGGLELDIVIPSLGIAIEANGIFWHSEHWIRKSKGVSAREYHENKRSLAAKANLRLLFVWEDDWKNHQQSIEAAIIRAARKEAEEPSLAILSKG